MNNMKIFENEEFGAVRTIERDGEMWFVGKDVAECLGYSNPQKAVRDHVDDEDKLTERFVLSGQNRNMIIINESGLYSLILSSKLPSAKSFKRWVTKEVIPSIRQHGGYIMNQENLSQEELLANAMIVAQSVIEKQKTNIIQLEDEAERNAPKIAFADAITASDDCILVRDFSKILAQNDIFLGERKLYNWFRERGYICCTSTLPTQKAAERRLFEVTERIFYSAEKSHLRTTTKITPKGQMFFLKKLVVEFVDLNVTV